LQLLHASNRISRGGCLVLRVEHNDEIDKITLPSLALNLWKQPLPAADTQHSLKFTAQEARDKKHTLVAARYATAPTPAATAPPPTAKTAGEMLFRFGKSSEGAVSDGLAAAAAVSTSAATGGEGAALGVPGAGEPATGSPAKAEAGPSTSSATGGGLDPPGSPRAASGPTGTSVDSEPGSATCNPTERVRGTGIFKE
jgi:hypothetical protein